MTTLRVALPTCENLPSWEIDDRPLHEALAVRDVAVERPAWTDDTVDWSAYDACLIRTTWDYQERLDEFLAWVRATAERTRLFNPLAIVEWNTHKSYLRDVAERGFPTAPTVWLDRGRRVELAGVLADHGWERGFLKPAVGATARETMRFAATGAELASAQEHLDRLLPGEDMLLQPYLARVETEGERSAIFVDGEMTHSVRKIPVPGDYRVQDDFGASDEPVELTEAELDVAHGLMSSIGDGLLYGRVDMLADDGGAPCVTELELVEPSLFFRHAPHAAEHLADALLRRIR
ncbi:MAG: ATP-grasp domain-containing protein [Planctomycetota bacterium]|jgi:glutathione synthase/RimK-type ligase-like ATP-grasp enzyme